jgi:sialate O-acetylesterase
VLKYQDEIARADYPMLRMFTVRRAVAGKPQTDVQGDWVAAHGQAVSDFSAVGLFLWPRPAEKF